MCSFVTHLVCGCCDVLRRLRSVRRYVSAPTMRTMMTSLVLSRMDHCNSLLNGVPAGQLRHLESVINAVARCFQPAAARSYYRRTGLSSLARHTGACSFEDGGARLSCTSCSRHRTIVSDGFPFLTAADFVLLIQCTY